jgi:hypothetical protein
MDLTENKKPIEVPEDADEEYLTEKIKKAMDYIDPKTDKFSKKTVAVLDELSEDAPAKEEKAPEPVTRKKAGKKVEEVADADEEAPAPKKKGKRPEKAGEPGKPGIIATIAKLIEDSGKKGVTKDEILETLKEEFPDRNEQSMKNTINVQVPARINKEKFALKKLEGNRYAKA